MVVLIAFNLMLDQLGTGMRELLQHHRQLPWVRETNHLLLSALDGFESRRIGREIEIDTEYAATIGAVGFLLTLKSASIPCWLVRSINLSIFIPLAPLLISISMFDVSVCVYLHVGEHSIWNEHMYNISYVKQLRSSLNLNGLNVRVLSSEIQLSLSLSLSLANYMLS